MNSVKKFLLVGAVLFSFLFFACENDNVTPDNKFEVKTSTCRIDALTRIDNGNTNILSYGYNEANVLRRIGTKHDGETSDYNVMEATFNDDSTLALIERYDIESNPDFLERSYTYTYSNGKIVTIVEQRNDTQTPYSTKYTYTYDGDNLASVVQTGAPDGENMKLTEIVYSNGNITSMKMDFNGDGLIVTNIKATFDNKFNHTKHMFPLPEQMMERFNNNNLISVELTEKISLGLDTIDAGSKIMDRVFSYNSKDEVANYVARPTDFDDTSENKTYTFTYICD